MKNILPGVAAAALGLFCLNAISGCHSAHIEATVENRTGATITLLEVDYPSASFGADTLAADGTFHHRIQTRGTGPLSVQYAAARGRTVQVTGPTLLRSRKAASRSFCCPMEKPNFILL